MTEQELMKLIQKYQRMGDSPVTIPERRQMQNQANAMQGAASQTAVQESSPEAIAEQNAMSKERQLEAAEDSTADESRDRGGRLSRALNNVKERLTTDNVFSNRWDPEIRPGQYEAFEEASGRRPQNLAEMQLAEKMMLGESQAQQQMRVDDNQAESSYKQAIDTQNLANEGRLQTERVRAEEERKNLDYQRSLMSEYVSQNPGMQTWRIGDLLLSRVMGDGGGDDTPIDQLPSELAVMAANNARDELLNIGEGESFEILKTDPENPTQQYNGIDLDKARTYFSNVYDRLGEQLSGQSKSDFVEMMMDGSDARVKANLQLTMQNDPAYYDKFTSVAEGLISSSDPDKRTDFLQRIVDVYEGDFSNASERLQQLLDSYSNPAPAPDSPVHLRNRSDASSNSWGQALSGAGFLPESPEGVDPSEEYGEWAGIQYALNLLQSDPESFDQLLRRESTEGNWGWRGRDAGWMRENYGSASNFMSALEEAAEKLEQSGIQDPRSGGYRGDTSRSVYDEWNSLMEAIGRYTRFYQDEQGR